MGALGRARSWLAACGACIAALAQGHGVEAQGSDSPRVLDLHVDLAYQLHVRGRSMSDERAETSPSRLRRGRVGMLVLPLYVSAAWQEQPSRVRASYEATYQSLMRGLRSGSSQGLFLEPGAPADGEHIATMLALEGADGFADDPGRMIPWFDRGLCLVGLVHDRTNALAGSSGDPKRDARRVALSRAGETVVRTAYGHGALIDLAHASDAAVADIARIARTFDAPLVCSHTGMRALKGIDRNIGDEQLRWIAASGGVVGVDMHSGHIGRRPGERATLDDYVRHIEHAVAVAGVAHVAIGSDLDGGIVQPSGAEGAATWPALARRLLGRGWRAKDVEALYWGNAARVLAWAASHGCG